MLRRCHPWPVRVRCCGRHEGPWLEPEPAPGVPPRPPPLLCWDPVLLCWDPVLLGEAAFVRSPHSCTRACWCSHCCTCVWYRVTNVQALHPPTHLPELMFVASVPHLRSHLRHVQERSQRAPFRGAHERCCGRRLGKPWWVGCSCASLPQAVCTRLHVLCVAAFTTGSVCWA